MINNISIQCSSRLMIYIKPLPMTGMPDGFEYHAALLDTHHDNTITGEAGHTLKKSLENLKGGLTDLPDYESVSTAINTFIEYLK